MMTMTKKAKHSYHQSYDEVNSCKVGGLQFVCNLFCLGIHVDMSYVYSYGQRL